MPSGKPKEYDTADGRPLWGAAKAAHERGRKSKPPVEGRICACGCRETTKGGEFMMGHDARHKSNLIKEALAGGNPEAEAELERRGWTKFLDKKREMVQRASEPRTYVNTPVEDTIAERLKLTADLKRAHELLKLIQRAPKAAAARAGKEWIETRYDNYEAILTGDLPEFTEQEQREVWHHQGIDSRAKVV